MLVYGDHVFELDPRAELTSLRKRLQSSNGDPSERISILIDAGALVQGLLDRAFEQRGRIDDWGPLEEACAAFLRFAPETVPLPVAEARIRVKLPEGFAFYALYPESYAEAARALPSGADIQCIGIRSIGVTLAAVIHEATRSRRPLVTVRPVGHPFSRSLSIAPGLERLLTANAKHTHYAIADEGPGLSGSSFAAVSTWLESHGVPSERIHFFPSHPGEPGSASNEEVRAAWSRVQRHFSPSPSPIDRDWAPDLIGLAIRVEEISGGHWRTHHFRSEAEYPACHPHQERRKFLVETASGRWLLKFAGLGFSGRRAFERARELADAGFSPTVKGLRHGYLVQPWLAEAMPLSSCRAELDTNTLLARVGEYLGFRARRFTSPPPQGASIATLYEMARHNTKVALGEDAAQRVAARFEPHLPALDREVVRIETDNRLHAWEWLLLPDGTLLKTDAVDHCLAHDLVGSQDVAWDFAGAAVELRLNEAELQQLIEHAVRHGARRPSDLLLEFNRIAYLAFQLGHQTMAADAVANQWPEEAERLRARADFYAQALV